ncbi:two-component system capsular synthesis response regulator RcsB [Luteibacter sp. Sphag1AF]|uniref:response regulator transcription factor n=1 Tax=Luteibacter sp. Sphag1AF TaxID=2587031 RepID=UPI0016086EE5|nr:response regulator transcription factor [Luteibacter sp. Sphag1AF]MBB3228648.1 two-component system capsular synthesis response regulator RcsB [Luteibacter sp. Sphag1AF]
MNIRIAIADDHPFVQTALERNLGDRHGIDVVGVAHSPNDLLALLDVTHCDVLLTDYAMPVDGEHPDGLRLLAEVTRRHPSLAIVVLTGLKSPQILRTIEAKGIRCLVSKGDDLDDIEDAIHAAFKRQPFRSPLVAQALLTLDDEFDTAELDMHRLTPREAEVVRMLAEGYSATEIARLTGRSHKTTSAQKISAKRKLGIELDTDLFRYAVTSGMVAASGTGRRRTDDESDKPSD